MVKIRLSRTGARNLPSYRLVVIDSRKKNQGKNIEVIGYYNPKNKPVEFFLKKDRLNYWLSKGAKSSPTISRLIATYGRNA